MIDDLSQLNEITEEVTEIQKPVRGYTTIFKIQG